MQNLNPIINPNIFPCIGGLNSLCFLTYHFLTNTDMTVIVVKVCRVCRFIYFSFDVDYIVLLSSPPPFIITPYGYNQSK